MIKKGNATVVDGQHSVVVVQAGVVAVVELSRPADVFFVSSGADAQAKELPTQDGA